MIAYQNDRAVGYLSNVDYGLFLPFQFNPFGIRIVKQTVYNTRTTPGYDGNIYFWANGGSKTISFDLSFDSRPDKIVNFSLDTKNPNRSIPTSSKIGGGLNIVTPGAGTVSDVSNRINQFGNDDKSIGNTGRWDNNKFSKYDYETIDGKKYNPDNGVLAQIAVLEAFLRPASSLSKQYLKEIYNTDRVDFERAFNIRGNKLYTNPPDCYFVYGTRVFRCKLMDAPIIEQIHNYKLVPERITTSIVLDVLELLPVDVGGNANRSQNAVNRSITVNFDYGSKPAANALTTTSFTI